MRAVQPLAAKQPAHLTRLRATLRLLEDPQPILRRELARRLGLANTSEFGRGDSAPTSVLGASSLRSSNPSTGSGVPSIFIESLATDMSIHLHRPTLIPRGLGVSLMLAERGRAIGIQGDVAKTKDLDMFAQVEAQFGQVDVLFANAAVAPFAPLVSVTEEHFDTLFTVNVRGLFFTVQKALALLSHGASVILNASVVAQSGIPGTSVYSATKAAVRSLGRTLAAELAHRQIRVNVVSPGLIETPFWEKVGLSQREVEAFGEQVVKQTPLARPGRPEEIAATVAFLASEEGSYFTGAELVADGGLVQV